MTLRNALPVVVRSGGELERILGRSTRRRTRRRFVLELPGMATGATQSLERRLNRLANACGCAEGAMCGLVGLVAGAVWVACAGGSWDLGRVARAAGAALACGVAGAVVGKVSGLALARYRLRRLVTVLARQMGSATPGGIES